MGLLASCAKAPSSAPAIYNACDALPLASYSRAQQAQVADELQAAPASAMWPGYVVDYGRQRAAIRACQAVRP